MAKPTLFATSPNGTLVYRSSGAIAPEKYYAKGNSVYNSETGRRVGYTKEYRNLTKSEQAKVEKAARSRTRTYRRRYQPWDKGQKKPRTPPKRARKQEREPQVPVTQEYLSEYANLIRDYAMQLRDGPSKTILMSITLEECEILHSLAYDVYEAFVQYGDRVMSGEESPHDRAVFERQGRRLAQLLKAIR